MKGYFTHLAKLSGVAVGASSLSARAARGALPRVTPDASGAPLHIEHVALVDSSQPTSEAASQRRPVDRTMSNDDSFSDRASSRTNLQISSEDQLAAREVAGAKTHQPLNDSDKKTTQQSELSFVRQTFTSSLPLEKANESEPDVARLKDVGLERQVDGKRGVIHVGELVTSGESKLAKDIGSFAAPVRPTNPQESSMPRDYLEAIREWLGSPTASRDTSENRGLVEQSSEKVITTPEQINRSPRSDALYGDSAPQSDIQEFSLSIGSISIIVEEPAQQPIQQTKILQPSVKASTGSQPRARDAFALSRSYFRGF